MSFFSRMTFVVLAIAVAFVAGPAAPQPALAQEQLELKVPGCTDANVDLVDIRETFGLAPSSIDDGSLEKLLQREAEPDSGTTLRKIAVGGVRQARYNACLATDQTTAALRILGETAEGLSNPARVVATELLLHTAFVLGYTWAPLLGLAHAIWVGFELHSAFQQAYEAGRTGEVIRWYTTHRLAGFGDEEAWGRVQEMFDWDHWFMGNEGWLRSLARDKWAARQGQTPSVAIIQRVADILHDRVDRYQAYSTGQAVAAVITEDQEVVVFNLGDEHLEQVSLRQERPFLGDRSTEASSIAAGESFTFDDMSFGADEVDVIDMVVLGTKATAPFTPTQGVAHFNLATTSEHGDFAPRTVEVNAGPTAIARGIQVDQYHWDFGDGSPPQQGPDLVTPAPHTYTQSGAYPVRLDVHTPAGTFSAEQRVTVRSPVEARLNVSPPVGPLGATYEFDGTESSSLHSPILNWSWDLGDGTTIVQDKEDEDGGVVEHEYTEAGNMNVRLTVRDAEGFFATTSRLVGVGTSGSEIVGGLTVTGADATWHAGLRVPFIATVHRHAYGAFVAHADGVWRQRLAEPAIATVVQHIQGAFVGHADGVWRQRLAEPAIDTVVRHIHGAFVAMADGVWRQRLEEPVLLFDRTPPETTAVIPEPDGQNDWHVSPVEVTLSAVDPESASGVAATYYQVNDADPATYEASFTIEEDGEYTITYWSEDHAGNMEEPQTIEFRIDQTPPETTALVQNPDGQNDWHVGPVEVTLAAVDPEPGSGVAATSYQVNDADPETYQAPFTIEQDGEYAITYWSEDHAGNVEEPQTIEVRIDQTPPTIDFTGNQGTYTVDEHVQITCRASDNQSGVAHDTCQDIDSPAYGFELGKNGLTVQATDFAGNVGGDSVTFVVELTPDGLRNVTDRFVDQGTARSLIRQLDNAERAGDDSARRNAALDAYLRMVEIHAGRWLTEEEAEVLMRLAEAWKTG